MNDLSLTFGYITWLAMLLWLLVEVLFGITVYVLSNKRYRYSLTLSLLVMWRHPTHKDVLSPKEVLIIAWGLMHFRRWTNSNACVQLDALLRSLNVARTAMANRFRADDSMRTYSVNYELCHVQLLKRFLHYTVTHPSITIDRLDANTFARIMIDTMNEMTMDYRICNEAETTFMLDEVIYWYKLSVRDTHIARVSLCPMPLFVILAGLVGYSRTDIHQELMSNTKYFGVNMDGIQRQYDTALRRSLGM